MNTKNIKFSTYQPKYGPLFSYTGPDLSLGPLPALFYFALSADVSLGVDPYNQLVQFSQKSDLRIFSCSLPCHTDDAKTFNRAMSDWATALDLGNDIISAFIHDLAMGVDFLITEGIVDPQKIAVAGLSRGALIATHLAAKDPRISTVLGFAPLTRLGSIREFEGLSNNFHDLLDLRKLIPQLINKHIRFYIGNRDTRVSTLSCFEFVHELAEESYRNNIRSAPIELIISASCGRDGHGTLPHIFKDGSSWIKTQLALDKES
ncbi:MAG: hypothetical protein P4L16_06040 [Chlamydiales bacterium]|nr:hypothetical protein [Chlamydiales bacterium]